MYAGQVPVVVPDHLRRFAHRDVGDVAQRHGSSALGHDRRVPHLGERIDVLGSVLDGQRHDCLVGFPDPDDVVSTNRESHRGHRLVHGDAVLGHLLEVELCIDEVAARDPLRDYRLRPGELLEEHLNVLRDLLDHRQFLPFHFYPDGRLDPGVLHHHARIDRLRPAVDVADDLHRLVHLGDQPVLGHPRTPLRPGLECHRRLDHFDRGGIGGRVRATELAKDPVHFGKRLQLPVHLLDDPTGLS